MPWSLSQVGAMTAPPSRLVNPHTYHVSITAAVCQAKQRLHASVD